MQRCRQCGEPVEFRFIDGRCIPLHTSGGCSNSSGAADNARVTRSADSECRKTYCPTCREPVYFIRHNGGSVWIDPPLGPPWERHPCFDAGARDSNPAQLISPDLAAQLGVHEQLVTGVVCMSEVSKDRRLTILNIIIGEGQSLTLLIKGGASALVGQLIVIACADRLIYRASEARICFVINAVLAGPDSLTGRGAILHLPLSLDAVQKVRAELKHGTLSEKQHRALRKFRDQGLKANWKLPELLMLAPLISGKDQDRAIHSAAVMIIEQAESHGDCSAAATLVRLVTPAKRIRLIAWFRAYSPISIDITRKRRKAHIYRTPSGIHRPWLTSVARTTPL